MILTCEACGASVTAGPDHPLPFRCPRAGTDDADHLLVSAPPRAAFPAAAPRTSSFAHFQDLLPQVALARAHGLDPTALIDRLDRAIADIDGHGFQITPTRESAALSRALGFQAPGAVWVKDETDNVSGSHKARHLMGIALYLEVAEALGWIPGASALELAIASCGNAALAAAVVARAADRTLRVFIPPSADPAVVARLNDLGALIEVCERVPGQAGDPCYLRFLEAVSRGAVPFCCQGPANGMTLDGGLTLAWELGLAPVQPDHIVVQVGGGALGSSVARGLEQLVQMGVFTRMPRFHTVQTEGAAPLARAHQRVKGADPERSGHTLAQSLEQRSQFMWPWEHEPHSLAHGILDDETYDWHRLVRAMIETGGLALVINEARIAEAQELAQHEAPASSTGAAGLAGLIELRARGLVGPTETAVVLLTGRVR